jgi:hypothetical protein
MRLRSALLLTLAALALGTPGCALYYGVGKFTGLISPEKFSTRTEIPQDFRMGVGVRDATDPATDFDVSFDRSGRAMYDVTVRAPRRKHVEGTFEVTEDQLRSLWKAVADARFDELEPRYPSEGSGKDLKLGVQKYYVFADNTDHKVETHFTANAALDSIRQAVRAVIPQEVITASGAPGALKEAPKEFLADTAKRMFHRPDCTLLKDVPAEHREPFATSFDALDHGYQPCPECSPLNSR